MQLRNSTVPGKPVPQQKPTSLQKPSEGGSTELLVKIAIPIGLAVLAGVLNASAVARQMQTQPFFAFKEELPVGHMLTESDVVEVNLGGELSQIPYMRPTVSSKSELVGRVMNRPVKKGELVVDSQFGGVSLSKGKSKSFELPRNASRSLARSVRPGQWVSFQYAIKSDAKQIYELGPFEVGPVDPSYRSESTDPATILNVEIGPDSDLQILKLLEVLENENKYHSWCIPHRVRPSSGNNTAVKSGS